MSDEAPAFCENMILCALDGARASGQPIPIPQAMIDGQSQDTRR